MMRASISIIFFLILPLFVNGYNLVDTVIGTKFYDFFDFDAIPDPTHGRVQYVDQATSQKLNLTYASADRFILRADYKTVLSPSGPGRKSVRIKSTKTFTTHVAIFDIRHMPEGCGTWPALWEVSNGKWPDGGEVDIIEGSNDVSPNAATLHTSAGCRMPKPVGQLGTSLSLNCQSSGTNNQGCGVKFPTKNSYGPQFNSAGGGFYALERTETSVKIWFFTRNDTKIPSDLKTGASVVNPSTWGNPMANFPATSCDFQEHFDNHSIIINLTLCGDWAGNTFSSSGCGSSCPDHVNSNPKAFAKAFFDIASIRVYE